MSAPRTTPSAAAFAALGSAVNRMTAAAGLARAVADHVPDGDDFGKLDCLDAIELHLLRPAAAELHFSFRNLRNGCHNIRSCGQRIPVDTIEQAIGAVSPRLLHRWSGLA